jgi:DNA-binding CsgD family transcriptional regulator
MRKKDGSTILTLVSAAPIFKQGKPAGARGIIIDIKPFFFSTILPDDSFFKEYSFTNREKEIMILLAQGLKYKEIAKNLGVSDNTLKSHMSNIYDKMGAGSRDEIFDIIKDFQVKHYGRDRLFFSILSMLMKD